MQYLLSKKAEPSIWMPYLLACVSGLMLAIPFLFESFYLLIWGALIPIMCAVQGMSVFKAYVLGVWSGFIMVVLSTYWLVPFIMNLKGYGIFLSGLMACLYWFYSAQLLGLMMLAWVALKKYGAIKSVLVWPIFSVLILSFFPLLFPVSWAHTQSQFLWAIQATDLVGIAGLDFIIMLVNAIFYGLLMQNKAYRSASFKIGTWLVMAWFLYGAYEVSYWDKKINQWPTKAIGIVQPNESPSIKIPTPAAGIGWSYPMEMQLTQTLAKNGADMVVWPESRYKGYFASPYVQASYAAQIKSLKTPIIFQDMESITVQEQGSTGSWRTKEFNTLLALDENAEVVARYRKMQRIALAEYLPLLEDNVRVNNWLKTFSEGFSTGLSPGAEHQKFSLAGMKVIPIICYEVLFSRFVAQAVSHEGKGAILTVVSNDSWFSQSRQPFQHGAMSSLRAVENRLPLVHVINNGPSRIVLPNGRVQAISEPFKKSALLVNMPYSNESGGSFYSKHPDGFMFLLYALAGGILLWNMTKRWVATKPSTSGLF